jgi:hypothetical protein
VTDITPRNSSLSCRTQVVGSRCRRTRSTPTLQRCSLLDHLIDGTADPPSTTNASTADRKGATTTAGASGERQNEATSFWHLGNLLTELFRHALEKSNAVESNPLVPPRNGSAGGGGEGESDHDSGVRAPTQLATVALGESISWGNGTMYNPARPSDPEVRPW